MSYLELSEERSELVAARLSKLDRFRAMGIDPYGEKFVVTHHAAEIKDAVDDLDNTTVAIAGRVTAIRAHGGSTFADLRDFSGTIQIYAKRDVLGDESYEAFSLIDVGDIIGVHGTPFRTRTGEPTVKVSKWVLQAKCLRPLPEKWHGLKDVDLRYRQRYLDLIMNERVRDLFVKRSEIIRAIRQFMDSRGFYEVETPSMLAVASGAAAKPFVTHHNALDMDLYLRIATELHLKRVIVGGFERVYEIGRVFRNEGISTKHNPEFTMMECYQAYADYMDMMELTEQLVAHVAREVLGTTKISYQGEEFDLSPPWERVCLTSVMEQHAGISFDEFDACTDYQALAAKLGLKMDKPATRATVIAKIIDELIEPKLKGPIIVMDYPVEISPLAKRVREDPRLTYRFEAFIAGRELANAFSELNDPIDQRGRFLAQLEERAKGDEEAQALDEDFLRAMEYGMPPTGGLGIGIDRLVMLLTDSASIREVILFPLMRPK